MRKMLMEFLDFDISMIIQLNENNEELCNEVWDKLPFTCVQEHGMVSGFMIYCWVPMISLANINEKFLHTESPIGTVNYSQGTGNKIIVKYGECNEDLGAPLLGFVEDKFLNDLEKIGKIVWDNYFNFKEVYKVRFSKL